MIATSNSIITAKLVASFYFVTFVSLASSTTYLVYAIHKRFKGSFKTEKRKLLLVLCVFSVSYTYRWVFDLCQMISKNVDATSAGGATAMFFLYFIGELMPLTAMFFFHYQNNKTFE